MIGYLMFNGVHHVRRFYSLYQNILLKISSIDHYSLINLTEKTNG